MLNVSPHGRQGQGQKGKNFFHIFININQSTLLIYTYKFKLVYSQWIHWDPKEHLPELQIAYLDHFSKIVSLPEQYIFGLSRAVSRH